MGENRACKNWEYCAPEVIKKEYYSKVSDWFAVGCIAYELMFTVTPFRANSRKVLERNITEGEIEFPN